MKDKTFWYCAAAIDLIDKLVDSDKLTAEDMRELLNARGHILKVMERNQD